MEAKEGVVLDQDGSVIYDAGGMGSSHHSDARFNSAYAGRTPIAWGGQGILPKVILAGVVGALLFLGFGIVAIVLSVMLVSFLARTLFYLLTGTPRPPSSKFTFVVKR